MAVFENPQEASLCALYIQLEMQKNTKEYDSLRLGIGPHEGSVVEGDVGSGDTSLGKYYNSVPATDEIITSAMRAPVLRGYCFFTRGIITGITTRGFRQVQCLVRHI